MRWSKKPFHVSTDKQELDFAVIHQFISQSYWAKEIPEETLQKGLDNSLCFGLYRDNHQIGFARVVTDGATFGYLADVFILPEYQGASLGKWLIECVMSHPDLLGLRRFMLATKDAHGLYEQFGFGPVTNPEILMQIHKPDIYLSVNSST